MPATCTRAANHAHALVLVTEWKEFRMPNWNMLRKIMHTPPVLDGRNIYNPQEIREQGFEYIGIGLGTKKSHAEYDRT